MQNLLIENATAEQLANYIDGLFIDANHVCMFAHTYTTAGALLDDTFLVSFPRFHPRLDFALEL